MLGYNAKTGNFNIAGRASFPVLVEPRPVGKRPKPGATPKYQCTVVISQEQQDSDWYRELKAKVGEAADKKWGPKGSESRPRKIKSPFLTTDDITTKVPEGYKDTDVFVRLDTTVRPNVVMKDGGRMVSLSKDQIASQLYAGCDVVVAVDLYAWTHEEGGAGVSLGLGNILKTGDNEPWGATVADPSDDFGGEVASAEDSADDDFLG